ncbi:MAG: glutamate racemase [Pseudomonadales bacterium]|nr:glutamate racemase [Pseudomonadales bacterium]
MTAHILIFDSGLGGTTVCEEIHKRLPECQFSYALDDAAFPYGNKSPSFLIDRINLLIGRLIETCQPDLIVIACNTASTLTLDVLRENYALPFVGVVPAIKPAAAESNTRHIGLLATDATINGNYINELENKHALHCNVLRLTGQELVEIAEQKILGLPIDHKALKSIIQALSSQPSAEHIDTLILGCTHFPALKEEIQQLWPQPIQTIDSGAAIAKRVSSLLKDLYIKDSEPEIPTVYTTGHYTAGPLIRLMQKYGINHHKKIAIHYQI